MRKLSGLATGLPKIRPKNTPKEGGGAVAPTIPPDAVPWYQSLFANGENGFLALFNTIADMAQSADGSTPVTASGQPVGRVQDKSPNARHGVQATVANKPTYTESGNQKFLQLDGATDRIAFPFTLGAAGTLGVAFRATSNGTVRQYVLADTAGSTVALGMAYPSNRPEIIVVGTTDVGIIDDISGQDVVLIVTWSGGTLTRYLNGVQRGTNTYTGTPAGSGTVTLGGASGGTNRPQNGRDYSAFGINRVLTTDEIALLSQKMQEAIVPPPVVTSLLVDFVNNIYLLNETPYATSAEMLIAGGGSSIGATIDNTGLIYEPGDTYTLNAPVGATIARLVFSGGAVINYVVTGGTPFQLPHGSGTPVIRSVDFF